MGRHCWPGSWRTCGNSSKRGRSHLPRTAAPIRSRSSRRAYVNDRRGLVHSPGRFSESACSASLDRPTTDTHHDPGPGVHKDAESADVDGWRAWRNLAIGDTLDKRTSHEVPLTPPHSHWIQRCGKVHVSQEFLPPSPMVLKDGASLRRRRRRVGEQHAVRLAARGVRLFITGRRGPEIADAAAAIGRGTIGVQADVSNLRDLDRLYEQISRDAGRLDVVFANAGGGDMLPLEAITAEHSTGSSATRQRSPDGPSWRRRGGGEGRRFPRV